MLRAAALGFAFMSTLAEFGGPPLFELTHEPA
jgi:hypothetical protein